MKPLEYSVVIRTTGQAHEKYRALLNSIDRLDPKPTEIIVVLPNGYDEPQEQLGYETYYYSPKGMVIQRMTGIAKCKTPYALVCDDDVTFGEDFVQKLYEPLKEGDASFSAGPLYSFFPPVGMNAVLCTVMTSAMPTVFHKKDRYVSVLKSTGYSYNRHLNVNKRRYYEAQSLPWTCFFADVEALRNICFDDELWLDSHGYSALDDQTMFYKALLNGYKTVVVADAPYDHLDAKTSTRNNKPAALYASTYNRVVFWRRFIYGMQSNVFAKAAARIAFSYRMGWMRLWNRLAVLRRQMKKDDYALVKKGYVDGWAFVKSKEFEQLAPVIVAKDSEKN